MATSGAAVWDRYCEAIDSMILAGFDGGRVDAGRAVQRAHPEFRGITPSGRIVASGNFVGRPGAAASASRTGGNAEAQIAALGDVIRRGNPTLTKEQAQAQALSQHPELYQQYLNEHPAQTTFHT